MSKKEIAVKVQDLTKTFKIPLEASNGLKQKLINTLKGRKGYREFSPLNDISFEINKGDFFGIVGRNGSGKSTLLKTIAGIYAPNEGFVQVNGKLVPFIELGVGFNPELTGRENVFLNGALLGFSHKQMEEMYDDIVAFAELEEFMEERLKNYSSGMQVRLAFSIAIRADGDILLLDEVLAVGDEAFQRKCTNYFYDLKKQKKTVILVTHDMSAVRKYCNKALLLKKGSIELIGDPDDIAKKYVNENLSIDTKESNEEDYKLGLSKDIPELNMKIHSDRVLTSHDELCFDIEYTSNSSKNVDTLVVEIINSSRGRVPVILDSIKDLSQKKGRYTVQYKYKLKYINDGDYQAKCSLRDKDSKVLAFSNSNKTINFAVRNEDNISSYPIIRNSKGFFNVKKERR